MPRSLDGEELPCKTLFPSKKSIFLPLDYLHRILSAQILTWPQGRSPGTLPVPASPGDMGTGRGGAGGAPTRLTPRPLARPSQSKMYFTSVNVLSTHLFVPASFIVSDLSQTLY